MWSSRVTGTEKRGWGSGARGEALGSRQWVRRRGALQAEGPGCPEAGDGKSRALGRVLSRLSAICLERGQSEAQVGPLPQESRSRQAAQGPTALLTQPLSQVHHINANYFLDITSMKPEDVENNVFSFSSTFEDPSTATYMQFLKEGLRRGLPLLQD